MQFEIRNYQVFLRRKTIVLPVAAERLADRESR